MSIGSFEFNWFMLVAVIALVAVLCRRCTRPQFGLRLMACGEHPQAADSVGINVYQDALGRCADLRPSGRSRAASCTSPAGVSEWRFEYGVAGFGFLSLAVMIFGQWKPTTHSAGSAAVRLLPGACRNVYFGFDFLEGHEYSQLHLQYAALHHLPCGIGLHLQEVQSA